MTPYCNQEMCWCSHGFAPVNLRQARYQQTIIPWLYFCVFLAFCGLYLKHTSGCTPLESSLLFIGVSNLQLRLQRFEQFSLWNLFTSVLHASGTDSPRKWTEHFSSKVQWFLEWELIWALPVATSPGERWWPPMAWHPEQDDGWIPPWRAQHLLKDAFQNPPAEIFSRRVIPSRDNLLVIPRGFLEILTPSEYLLEKRGCHCCYVARRHSTGCPHPG